MLNLVSRADISAMMVKKGEVIIFSGLVTKLNRVDKQQERALVMTDKAIYNFVPNKYTKWKRRILLKDITAVTQTTTSYSIEFVLHVPTQYDYRYRSVYRENLLTCLVRIYQSATHKQLRRNYCQTHDLKHVAMTKTMSKSAKAKMVQIQAQLDTRPPVAPDVAETEAKAQRNIGRVLEPTIPMSIFGTRDGETPLCFVLAGPPNAGKTTQCKIFCSNTGLIHLSPGENFRKAMAEKTELGEQVKVYIDRGDMVPDSLVISHIVSRISDTDVQQHGCILDGFPRTSSQAQALLAKIRVDAFIQLKVPMKALFDRAKNRRVDPVTGDIYNLKYVAPPEEIAPRLLTRDYDDNLRVRLIAYQNQFRRTQPYFKGICHDVNGLQSVDKVSASLAGVIRNVIAARKAQPAPAPSSVTPNACVICLDAPADHLIVPCGHKCGCSDCLSRVDKCPICRIPITKIQRVFEAGAVDDTPAPPLPTATAAAAAVPTRADVVGHIVTGMVDGSVGVDDLADSDEDWGDEEEATADSGGPSLTIAPCVDMKMTHRVMPVSVQVDVPDKSTREPVDICCVVDVSGSMISKATYEVEQANGEVIKKNDGFSILDIVKHAIKAVMHMLEPDDRVAVVAFNNKAQVVFRLSRMDATTRARCISKLAPLPPSGQTNIWAGLVAGMDLLRQSEMQRPKYLLLLTDGVPNISPPRGHVAELQSYRELHPELFRSFQLHSFGFGYQLDSKMLLDLAVEGNGSYAFIPDAVIVGTVFVNTMANLLCNSFANCKLHLTLKGGAKFAGGMYGNYASSDEAWGKVVRVGVLQCGQRRTFVVPLKIPAALVSTSEPYLEAHLTYHHSALGAHKDGSECRASAAGTAREATLDATAALLRSQLVSAGYAAVDKPGKAAQRTLATLAKDMLRCQTELRSSGHAAASGPASSARARINAMSKDVGGRMLKALRGVKRFERWGRHYLRAISRAHQMCICANFMDTGLQVYGGKFFQSLRDKGDKVFLSIPMAPPRYQPKRVQTSYSPSTYTYTSATPAPARTSTYSPPTYTYTPATRAPAVTSAATYYAGSGGGCFGAGSVVSVQDSATGRFVRTKITSVRPGDVLATTGGSTARVRCVTRIALNAKSDPLLRLPCGLQITPKHPVRMAGGQWCRPKDMSDAQRIQPEHLFREGNNKYFVYNFLLDSTHVVTVNGIECVTWGHGMTDPSISHPYFGDMTAIERDLSSMSGWTSGFVSVDGCRRDLVTHKVVGLCCAV